MGLTGVYSPHSLRYAWAQDAIHHYLAQGFSRKEALAMVAMELAQINVFLCSLELLYWCS